jgi:hypothetical protein
LRKCSCGNRFNKQFPRRGVNALPHCHLATQSSPLPPLATQPLAVTFIVTPRFFRTFSLPSKRITNMRLAQVLSAEDAVTDGLQHMELT